MGYPWNLRNNVPNLENPLVETIILLASIEILSEHSITSHTRVCNLTTTKHVHMMLIILIS